jgi:hypothetical protein
LTACCACLAISFWLGCGLIASLHDHGLIQIAANSYKTRQPPGRQTLLLTRRSGQTWPRRG